MSNEMRAAGPVLMRLMAGSKWFVGGNSLQRFLGLTLTVIMARVLEPREVGLVAIAWLIINALDVLTRSGASDALIHLRDDIESYLPTYFWLELSRGAALAVLILLLAPVASIIFDEPAAYQIICILSLVPIAKAFRSPGIVLLRRALKFRTDSAFISLSSVLTFSISCGALLIWRRLDILVWTFVIGEILTSLVSHYYAPYFPKLRFDLRKAGTLLRYGRWLLGSGIVSYLSIYLDRYVIGKLGDASMLGLYSVAVQLGEALTYRVSKVLSLAVQPAYASLQATSGAAGLFQIAFKLSFILFALVAAGLWAWGRTAIPVLLGDQWIPMIPAFSLLVLAGFIRALSAAGSPYFKGIGRPKAILVIELIRATTLALAIFPAFTLGGITGAAGAVLLASLVQLLWTANYLRVEGCIDWPFVKSLLPAACASIAAGAVMRGFSTWVEPEIVAFLLGTLAAFVLYCGMIYLAERHWLLSILDVYVSAKR